MINREAILYTDYHKNKELGIVNVLHIGTVADEDGSNIMASVELPNGDVIEVVHDRLKFIEKRK